jgi:hypothetical protein
VFALPSTALAAALPAVTEEAVAGWFSAAFVVPQDPDPLPAVP